MAKKKSYGNKADRYEVIQEQKALDAIVKKLSKGIATKGEIGEAVPRARRIRGLKKRIKKNS